MFNPNIPDQIDATTDALILAIGGRLQNPHPMSGQRDKPLKELARLCGARDVDANSRSFQISAIGSGMKTKEFSDALATVLCDVAQQAFNNHAVHRIFCGFVDTGDFRDTEVNDVDADVSMPESNNDGFDEIMFSWATGDVLNTCKLASHRRIIGFSRKTIINNDVVLLRNVVMKLGITASVIEQGFIARALTGNSTLGDGSPVFSAEFNNVVSGGGSNLLAKALAALRKQEYSGGVKANLAAAHYVVPPEQELYSCQLLRECGMENRIRVSVLSSLPADHSYLLASPGVAPAVGVLRLDSESHPLRIEQRAAPIEFDGAQVRAIADLGAVLLGRVGVVRCLTQ